jgi:hypothetical protein
MNLMTMETTSIKSLPKTLANIIPESSPLIRQSESESAEEETYNSPISTNLQTSMKVISRSPDAAQTMMQTQAVQSAGKEWITVKDGTSRLAVNLIHPATIGMCAQGAEVWSTLKRPAHLAPQTDSLIKCPQYLCGMAWFLDESSFSPTAKSSLYATPLPPPGERDFTDTALSSLNSCPDLFMVVTPVNIKTFSELLQDHPNRPFVESILRGLREGFWPCADTTMDGYPLMWDNSFRPLKNEEHQAFIQEQVDEEVRLGRFSHPFGLDLLEGMYSTPVHVVPKPNLSKLWLVIDHSAGEFSLNSMINLDGMQSLGLSLLQFR